MPGFSDTHERLDLLALDKQGSLVLIENKLDDTGRDQTWQALKHASYRSRLSKENVRQIYQEFLNKTDSGADAKERMTEFLDADDCEEVIINRGITLRTILIAANFRKEVTSTVLWRLNFKLRVHYFRGTPYSMGTAISCPLALLENRSNSIYDGGFQDRPASARCLVMNLEGGGDHEDCQAQRDVRAVFGSGAAMFALYC